MKPLPIIAICGTTGVGKSNLAVELAVHLSRGFRSWKGARVINADAMQVYRGTDVLTNKIPESERQGIEHLLLGFKEPGEQYVVGQWVQDALKAISDTHNRDKIPIVVGGTSYWIQHLIFPSQLVSEDRLHAGLTATSAQQNFRPQSNALANSIACLNTDLLDLFTHLPIQPPSASTDSNAAWKLYSLLVELDPVAASRWHWRDTRKVLRSLQIIQETKQRASEVIAEQLKDASRGRPRFPTLIFWLYSEPSALVERLNSRVDRMIQQGLLDEVEDLKKIYTASGGHETELSLDYTCGIYQSIGYREFDEYLMNETPTEVAFKSAVEKMKISTRQYAKRQVSWIRNKLLPASKNANVLVPNSAPIYLLDATEPAESWEFEVKQKAIRTLEDFLAGRVLPDPLTTSPLAFKMLNRDDEPRDLGSTTQGLRKITCSTCTTQEDRPFMVNEGLEWQAHQRSKAHQKLAAKRKQGSHAPNITYIL